MNKHKLMDEFTFIVACTIHAADVGREPELETEKSPRAVQARFLNDQVFKARVVRAVSQLMTAVDRAEKDGGMTIGFRENAALTH